MKKSIHREIEDIQAQLSRLYQQTNYQEAINIAHQIYDFTKQNLDSNNPLSLTVCTT